MYKKRYSLEEIEKVINGQIEQGKRFLNIEGLLIEIGFDVLDINEFYIKNIRHHFRYEREEQK
jgi:hypothetical protein